MNHHKRILRFCKLKHLVILVGKINNSFGANSPQKLPTDHQIITFSQPLRLLSRSRPPFCRPVCSHGSPFFWQFVAGHINCQSLSSMLNCRDGLKLLSKSSTGSLQRIHNSQNMRGDGVNTLIEARKSHKVMTVDSAKKYLSQMSQDSGNPANLIRKVHFSTRKECDLGPRSLNTGHMIVDSVTSIHIYNFKLVKGPQVLKSLNQISMVKQFKLVWAAVSSMRNHGGQQIWCSVETLPTLKRRKYT